MIFRARALSVQGPEGDLFIFNRGVAQWEHHPAQTHLYTSQKTLLQDTVTVTVTFLIQQLRFILLSSFYTYNNCPFKTLLSKYTFKL